MAGLNETPSGNRIRIAFFGLRNAGKSTLVNSFTGQHVAIVSAVPGTTTDPVSKSMEILPLGPCVVTDTAGLDDIGDLGRLRVEQTLKVLDTTDIAVWVWDGADPDKRSAPGYSAFLDKCGKSNVVVIEYFRGESVDELKRKIAAVKIADAIHGLLDGLVESGDRVVCVVPIDESAPKGRLILPQQQVIRECLEIGAVATVCKPETLAAVLADTKRGLVVTDSQAFGDVRKTIDSVGGKFRLTSFSVLFARQKGDIAAYVGGLSAISRLKDGDRVLVAEGCTHHRQCNDIGSVKIPKALEKLSGARLVFEFTSGNGFVDAAGKGDAELPALIVQCGGCMLTRREVLRRIAVANETGIPIVNYGMVLAAASGVDVATLDGITRP